MEGGQWYCGVFEDSGIRDITLPSTLQIIEYGTFRGCTELCEIQLPEGLLAINDGAFYHTGLIRVDIPASVTHIGVWAFSNCESLTMLLFAKESALKVVRDRAFSGTALNFVSIPREAVVSENVFDERVQVLRE